jgi:hypothetical protein
MLEQDSVFYQHHPRPKMCDAFVAIELVRIQLD